MEEALRDVDVPATIGAGRLVEDFPVPCGRACTSRSRRRRSETSKGTPIACIEASMRSRSVFDRIPSRQPRSRAAASPCVTSPNTGHVGSERASAFASPSGRSAPCRWQGCSRAIERTSRYDDPGLAAWIVGSMLVEASDQLIGSPGAEQLLELRTDAAVPVDQRAVAVERRPALHAASLISAS